MNDSKALDAAISEVSNFHIFSDLDLKSVSALCESGKIIVSQHKEILYRQGDPADSFGIVLSGAYKLSKPTLNGEDTIVHFSAPGDVIGAFIMSQHNPVFPVSSYSMGPSRFLKIPRHVYLERWKNWPEVLFKIQNLLSSRIATLQAQKTLIKAPLPVKIAHFLIDTLNKYEGNSATSLSIPITRKEIADHFGASVESVIRVMSQWSKKGLIETHSQQIKVLKMDKILKEMENF